MIQHVKQDETEANAHEVEETWKGYFYGLLLFITLGTQSILQNQYLGKMFELGMRARTILTAAIYKKSLTVPLSARRTTSTGEIVNLMSIDVQRIMDVFPYLNMVWHAPMQISLATYFIYNELGNATFVGIGVLILLMPINLVLGYFMKVFQRQQMKFKDQRLKSMNEVLSGVKILKLYAWEESFLEQILRIRRKEIHVLKKNAVLNALMSLFWTVAPFTVGLGAFAFTILSGNQLTADSAFVTLSYLNIMRVPFTMLPMMILLVVQVKVSLKRINDFMNTEDLDPEGISHNVLRNAVTMKHVDVTWSPGTDPALKDIDVEIETGSLTAVVGSVGSGKTSLISALLGELDFNRGNINTQGTIAYVPQQPWIQHGTLKENITFGRELDKEKYKQVIEACALTRDVEILPAGDQTEIGEKGLNLSGGQKQRVSLARAVYRDEDLYLLDDPLSAVDSHVGKHIFDHVIGPKGMLKNKTRIFVTNGLPFVSETDNIVVLEKGTISMKGSYHSLLGNDTKFSKFLKELDRNENDNLGHRINTMQDENKENFTFKAKYNSECILKNNRENGKLTQKEAFETGGVKNKVYQYYFSSVGLKVCILCMLLQIMWTGSNKMSNYWLDLWTENAIPGYDSIFYLEVYAGLGGFQALFNFMLMLVFGIKALQGASSLHNEMLVRVLKSPMAFYDTTPIGRIVNRLSKDIDVCDGILPQNMTSWLNAISGFTGTMVSIVAVLPVLGCLFLPACIVFIIIQKLYVATSRQLKRLESVSRSPIYSQFGETLNGISTIRAYKSQEEFTREAVIINNKLNIGPRSLDYFI